MMMADISAPTCSKCRWFKEGKTPPGGRLGILVQSKGWDGFSGPGGQHFKALGAGYCENVHQPRGLVLTNYACPNFEQTPEVDDQKSISEATVLRISA
ncbi:hypothetical protein [Devosia aurantiaca]|uniref:Uncharacterized protein n=1 Tax=Devosia aurantiaca TaxID=2714858 RepID=A0A6M1SPV8_9HYPH|nr:hypothetical protein [Devosia aurantiaca]NGP19160.1 hypothetical protein [Devosia aurantiaca]